MTEETRRGKAPVFIVVALCALLLLPMLARLYIDQLWFTTLELPQVFATTLQAKVIFAALGALVFGGTVYLNAKLAMRLSAVGRTLQIQTADGALDLGWLAPKIALPASAIVAFLAGSSAPRTWGTWLSWIHASSFGIDDPIFHRDVGFYVFTLPALELVFSALISLLVLSFGTAAIIYTLRGAGRVKT